MQSEQEGMSEEGPFHFPELNTADFPPRFRAPEKYHSNKSPIYQVETTHLRSISNDSLLLTVII